MHEIGQILIDARLKLGLELDQAALETNIAKSYIEALESDDYSVFPAEPYVQGFLRNYCEYLGLDTEEIIRKYKHVKVQINDPPPEVLLPKKKLEVPKIAVFAVFIILLAAGLGAGVFALLFTINSKNTAEHLSAEIENVETIDSRKTASYELKGDTFDKRLFEGDSVNIAVEEEQFTLTVKKTLGELQIDTPSGLQVISMGQSRFFDLNKDLHKDIEITLLDIDKSDASKGARVLIASGLPVSGADIEEDVIVSSEAEPVKNRGYKVLFEGGSAYPVTLNGVFRGYCLFRYEIDKTVREERYYQKSEQISIQAKNGFRIWASNGNTVKLQFAAGGKTVDLDVNRPGEVIVKDYKWIKNDDNGRYLFAEIDVD